MKQMVTFIIISYRPRKEELRKLVKILCDYPTIVVDNSGTVTSDDVGKATLLSQPKNVGFGAGANIGIRYASGIGADWFVILNQDTTFSKKAVGHLVRKLIKLPPGVAGPFAGALDPKRWTTVLPSTSADYVSGSCIAVEEKVIAKTGYFFEPYFLYYEAADYCVRAKAAGFSITRLDIPDIRHEETGSLGKGTRLHQYYLARNHLLFIKRLAPFRVKLYETFRAVKTVGEHLAKKESGALIGIKDFLLGRFGPDQGRGV